MIVEKWESAKRSDLVDKVKASFLAHRPVVIPTDTVYGLAAPIHDTSALGRIFGLKGRPVEAPLPVAVADGEMLAKLVVVTESALRLIDRFMPGPLTIVLPARYPLPMEVSSNDSVAVRIPDHPLVSVICGLTGPIALTSANRHGSSPPINMEEVLETFSDTELLSIEDDERVRGTPTTIISFMNGGLELLREGEIKIEEVREAANE